LVNFWSTFGQLLVNVWSTFGQLLVNIRSTSGYIFFHFSSKISIWFSKITIISICPKSKFGQILNKFWFWTNWSIWIKKIDPFWPRITMLVNFGDIQFLVKFWSIFGQLLVNFWSTFGHKNGQILNKFWFWTNWSISIKKIDPFWPRITMLVWSNFGQVLVKVWSGLGELLVNCWTIFGKKNGQILNKFWFWTNWSISIKKIDTFWQRITMIVNSGDVQFLVKFWSTFGQLLVNFWSTFGHKNGQILNKFWFWTNWSISIKKIDPFWPRITMLVNLDDVQILVKFWSIFGQLLVNFWSTFGQLLVTNIVNGSTNSDFYPLALLGSLPFFPSDQGSPC